MSSDAASTLVGERPVSGAMGGVGVSSPRPDGIPKVQGRFAFGSDLFAPGMLWGHTLRSPHASARIESIDVAAALAMPGVHAVVTAEDVPGDLLFGLEVRDQPVFAHDVVRYMGEPVAAVAADHPDIARRACAAITVRYGALDALVDPELATDPATPAIHPDGNVVRHLTIRHGDTAARGDVTVEGSYEVGMQDQAPLGTEAGLAIPAATGIDLFVPTQSLHGDLTQIASCLGLPEDQVHITLAGVGGAFGAREDVSLQVHLCLLALRTGRPVKMVYNREESFFGHVHRHPARLWYRHHAMRDGTLVKVEARLVLDGGAYTSSSPAVIANASCFAAGPYLVPNALVDGWVVRTNNPPCGAMRGFGAVQTCFAHEAQMDRLAEALSLDPIDLRLRNALQPGDRLLTGQVITGTAPVAEVIRACADLPLPDLDPAIASDPRARPGGVGRTSDPGDLRRGIGFAVGFKNIAFSEGFDDYSTARVELSDGVATVTCACAEVGQGFVTLAQQITREVLGIEDVVLAPADTSIGSAGSTSASRQTWVSGGAVLAAAEAVRDQVLAHVASTWGVLSAGLTLQRGRVLAADGSIDLSVADATASAGGAFEATVEYHHAPTAELDEDGQGDAHLSFAFAAHRAVVDVDAELGLVRLVDLTTAQDVGKVLNPVQLRGQLEGGAAQGVGLALMEEIVVEGGLVRNPSFTDYLIPTVLDLPDLRVAAVIEQPEPGAPFGAKGAGEPPTISSGAAVAAAIGAATGCPVTRIPVRPQDIAVGASGEPIAADGGGRAAPCLVRGCSGSCSIGPARP